MPLYSLLLSETPPHAGLLTLSLPPMTAFLWIFALVALLVIALWLASQRPLEYAIESHAHSHDDDTHHHTHHETKADHETKAAQPHLPTEMPMAAAAPIAAHVAVAAPVVAAPPAEQARVVPVTEPATAVAAPPASQQPVTVTPDDLKIIEGIGPKIAALLNQAGIHTFNQLAATPTARFDEILTAANLRRLADPGTWAQQAALAAANQWDELKRLQDTLKGGKQTH